MTTADELVFIADGDKDRKTVYNCKDKKGIAIPATWDDFTKNALKGIYSKGNTLYVTVYMCVGKDAKEQEIWKNVKLTFKNYNYTTEVYSLINHHDIGDQPQFPDDYVGEDTSKEQYNEFIEKLWVIKEDRGTITTSDFNDTITLEDKDKAYTLNTKNGADKITLNNTYYDATNLNKTVTKVNAGAGANDITVSGKGNNLITAGKDNDTFTFTGGENNLNKTTIKAGGGENTIAIEDDITNYGEITVKEEKLKAKNNIVINNIGDKDEETGELLYSLTKRGNDLTISNDYFSSVTVNDYFSTNKKKATTTFNGKTLDEIVAENKMGMIVYGMKTVKGTDYTDDIQTLDSEEGYMGKAYNDKIYAGKSADTINAGKGKNSIYMYAGGGADTITDGGGVDTLIFKKGSKISFGHVKTDEGYDLRVYYNKNSADDYAVIKNVVSFNEETQEYSYDLTKTSVAKLKVGSKTYKLDALLKRNKIENVLKRGAVDGTTKHDDIYVTDSKKFKDGKEIVISGNLGNDNIMIGSNQESANGNEDGYNIDPANYRTIDIKPTVYTHLKDTKDTMEGTYDKVASYASNGGTYYAQSTISDIKVYGDGTDDTYHTYYDNQFTKLYDESGNDTLYIEDKASDNLKLIFNITKDYTNFATEIGKIETITDDNKGTVFNAIKNSFQEVKLVTSDDRAYFLTDTDENNDIGIDIDYWGDKGLSEDSKIDDNDAKALLALGKEKLAKFGGGIEKIIASDGKYLEAADIAQVAANVADWLNNDEIYGGRFDSVEAVFKSTTEGAQTAQESILTVFDTVQWHDAQA